MNLQDQRGLLADRARVVGDCRLVGGADLAKRGSARLKHLRDAEAAADLHEFAARDNDFGSMVAEEMTQNQYQSRGAVVDDGCGRRATKDSEIMLEIRRPTAARSAGQTKLEVVVIARDVRHVAQN